MSVFDPDSIAYGRREMEIEEAWETAVEEAIAVVADAYSDACASLEQHEADFNESQISAGRWAVFSHFLRAGVEAVVESNATHKELSE